MTDTAAAQLRRILTMIPELADDEEHSLSSVAERVGVDTATLLRDLKSLAVRFDEPGGFVEGVQLFLEPDRVSIVSDHFRRPMRLTLSELCALELALAMLRSERPPEEHRAIDRARERLRTVIAKLPGDEITDGLRHAEVGAAGRVEHLAAIREALREGRKLRLAYRRGAAEEVSTRMICPYSLVVSSGMWYVVARCEESDGLRIFRLDRIEHVEPLSDRCQVPESFSLSAVLREGRVLSVEGAHMM